MRIDGGFNTGRVIAFLKALLSDAPYKIFMIVDNRKDHTAALVKEELKDK